MSRSSFFADDAAARLSAGVASYALSAPVRAVLAPTRGSADVALARKVAMYLCHVAFEFSLTRVAAAFRRDRSTVAHACHYVEDRREDPAFDLWISGLEELLRDTPVPTRAFIEAEAKP